ncbi:hypothetical protein [Litorihabitans aurantiacus]|uniref:hypothetical protein n=1 Tax=Litorihabitans aurantiacus TaxID=1930061 RepID=UPI0024E15DC4|nr:hypothetical protein [Litorihabitans aurantiacus]
MEVGDIIQGLATLGLGAIITKLIDYATTRRREQRESQGKAWEERDREARARRILEEYAHKLRRNLFRRGAKEGPGEDDVAPWPDYHTTKE